MEKTPLPMDIGPYALELGQWTCHNHSYRPHLYYNNAVAFAGVSDSTAETKVYKKASEALWKGYSILSKDGSNPLKEGLTLCFVCLSYHFF